MKSVVVVVVVVVIEKSEGVNSSGRLNDQLEARRSSRLHLISGVRHFRLWGACCARALPAGINVAAFDFL